MSGRLTHLLHVAILPSATTATFLTLGRAKTPAVRRRLRAATCSLAMAVALLAAMASPAAAQIPVAPANGVQITANDVVLRWTLEPGWYTKCVEWSSRPETSYPGGPFLAPDYQECYFGQQDVAYLLDRLRVKRYYWHVQVGRKKSDDRWETETESAWGPTAYFDSVEPPPPPQPRGCSSRAAAAMADALLVPHAARVYPRYYQGTGDIWTRAAPICRDFDGDGDREMVVRLSCCTGGSLSPWAIFKHDSSGAWRMKYVQVRDTVFRLNVRRHVVRTMLPAPYEGACTRFVRYRLVRWSGGRFSSRLTRRTRGRHSRGC